MGQLWQDLRFGIRTISKDRGFFFASVLALALGIGSTTAIFSVIYNVLLDPFPYTNSDRIFGFDIRDRSSGREFGRNGLSIPEFLDYREKNRVFERSMGVWEESVIMGDTSSPELFDCDTVTGNTFQFLGVRPLFGRGIEPSDAVAGAPPVFVLSYKAWRRRFGMDPSIVGKTYVLNGKPTTLIGIMPRRFTFWGGEMWMPASVDRSETGAAQRRLVLYGHLKPDLDRKAAESDLKVLAEQLSKVYRDDYPKQFDVHMMSLGEIAFGRIQGTLIALLAAVALLLLIACANVANLLLAKATTREKELALRITLGAGRFRVIRQLMAENVVLAFAGAALGCFLAWLGLKGLINLVPLYTFPDEADIRLNTPVLLATLATAMMTAFIFGLAPALTASRSGLNEALKSGTRGNSGFRRARLRNVLIVGEVALSLLLLSASGLLMRSFFVERQEEVGIRSERLLITSLRFPPKLYQNMESQARFLRELLPRLERLPGVVSAAGAFTFPPNGGVGTEFEVASLTHSERWRGYVTPCSQEFFETAGLRMVAGRLPTVGDEEGHRKVAVINQSMATKYFGGENPIGRGL